ncbi:hypothetical protein CFC21_066760 [Triticum aestivum]|uniref:Mitochondrial carrier protein n=2 Tax=Triticum aestivum TaxID=4565 RepID=A0A9R1KMV7_WHEAT|nr:hypothetical protein CFC21_066760 [Triticum aestivum]
MADPTPTRAGTRTSGMAARSGAMFDTAVASTPAYAREMLAGGVAGVAAKTAVASLGRVKLLCRTGGEPGGVGAVRTLVGIYRREGVAGLYRGNGANALRVFPSKALHFAAYERYRGWLLAATAAPSSSVVDLLAGSAAGGTALLATYPLELTRARLACGGDAARTSVHGVLRAAYAEGGGVRGLYRGACPALARALPRAGIKFGAYEWLKRRLPEGCDGRADAQLACGVAAAQLASTATYPLGVVRRRMQLGLATGGVLQGIRAIAREEGMRRLYAGLGIAYVKAVPAAAIGLAAYDQMKLLLNCRPVATARVFTHPRLAGGEYVVCW